MASVVILDQKKNLVADVDYDYHDGEIFCFSIPSKEGSLVLYDKFNGIAEPNWEKCLWNIVLDHRMDVPKGPRWRFYIFVLALMKKYDPARYSFYESKGLIQIIEDPREFLEAYAQVVPYKGSKNG